MSEQTLIKRQDGILTIAWNRPDKKNALTQEMYALAADALAEADSDSAIRVALITGTPDCFTAGNDLQDFMSNRTSGEDAPVARFLRGIAAFEKPLLAAVNGPAVGVGTTMLLHCDMVVAADTAVFALPFAKLGLCPEASSSYLLPMMAGHHRAAELLMLGDNFSAEMAHACGIVNRVAPAKDYLDVATALARQFAAMPPRSMRVTKQLLKANHRETAELALEAELKHFNAMLGSPEAHEAMTAFMEKRPADFSKF